VGGCLVKWVGASFLREYLHAMGESPIVQRRQDELSKLLSVLVLEKAVYEVDYELNNRPDWLRIPLRGVIQEINTTTRAASSVGLDWLRLTTRYHEVLC